MRSTPRPFWIRSATRRWTKGAALTFTATASDPEQAANTLTFSLDAGAPSGASIDPSTGVFSWTPTEAQGPGTYSITVRVTDTGTPAQSDFETINVTVNEVNAPPVLASLGDKAIQQGMTLQFTATASDPDLPANGLTFALDAGAPLGAAIHPTTGVFTWTPSDAQGPGTYTITVRVTDNGSPGLSDTETVQITVTPRSSTNNPPVLDAIGDQTVDEGTALTFTATASDPDVPANTFDASASTRVPRRVRRSTRARGSSRGHQRKGRAREPMPSRYGSLTTARRP